MGPELHGSGTWEISRGTDRIVLEGPFIAAPMAGVVDTPYRKVLHRHGCQLSFSEMTSARGLCEGSRRTGEIAGWVPSNGHGAAQLFGHDPRYLSSAAKLLSEMGHHMIDLNAGCPKRKVLSQGSGGALLNDPDHLVRCLGAIIGSVEVPVGLKMRSGYSDHDPVRFRKLLEDIQAAGASYVVVHPRTVSQGFRGSVDLDVISLSADVLDIPLIASGDVRCPSDVVDRLDRGAKGVMVGRALMGDPSWMERCGLALHGGDWSPFPNDVPTLSRHFALLKEHLEESISFHGESKGCTRFRTHLHWYLHGMRERSFFRDRIFSISDPAGTMSLVDEVFGRWSEDLLRDR